MKHARSLSLLLALLLLAGLMAGCASQPVSTPAESTDTPADTPDETPAGTSDEAPAQTPDDTDEAPAETPDENVLFNAYGYEYYVPQAAIDGVSLPLADDNPTISYFCNWTNNYASGPQELYSVQEIARRTGVNVDFTTVSTTEQFQIMYVSQDYTDIIKAGPTNYAGGVDKAIDDEVYIDANDVAAYTPVFQSWLTTSDEFRRECTTDSGALLFNSIQSGKEPAWCGAAVRGDWLDDCGLEAPETYDDWYEMLVAFRDVKGVPNAMRIGATGYEANTHSMTAGYGIAVEWFQVDGQVQYGAATEGMREYLTMMNKWYSEDLIDKDFPGYSSMFVSGIEDFATGSFGAWDMVSQTHIDSVPAAAGVDGYIVPVTSPVKNEGDEYHLRRNNQMCGNNCFFITTAAVDRGVMELVAKWIDFHYTLEGAYIMTFGEEGVDWTFGEDGLPHFTEIPYEYSEGKSIYMDQRLWSFNSSYYIWWKEFDRLTEGAANAYATWQNASDAAYNYPDGTALTAEESENFASAYGDIQTYVQENVPLFIRGDRSLDEFDDFVAALYDFGLEECISYKQAALDRYLAR